MNNNYHQTPDKVKWAIWLLWGSLILGVLSTIPLALAPLPPEAPKWLNWAIIVLSFGLFALQIYLISQRHNWARIAGLIYYSLGLVMLARDIPNFFSGPVYHWGISLITIVMTIVAFYWLFTGEGAAWFRRAS